MIRCLALTESVLDRLVAGTGATEVTGPDGGSLLSVQDRESGNSGEMRVFEGGKVRRIVWTRLSVPARQVTTTMIFGFAPVDSAVPHYTLDCADHGPDAHAFHLDVMPRVQLATHVPYMDAVMAPLTPLFNQGLGIDGITPTPTSPRQIALMSPWMLIGFATPEAFEQVGPLAHAYADHWLSVLTDGLSPDVVATTSDTDVVARDRAVRHNLFSPEVDPVWGRVETMVGKPAAEAIRAQLRDE